MDPFRWTRQSFAFIALMAGVAVIVGVAAPFGSIALGVAALLAIGVVLIKAMLRTRNWWPMSAVEGTVALSGLVLVTGAVAVVAVSMVRFGMGEHVGMMVGWPYMNRSKAGVTSRAVHYSDPDMRQRLKDELRAAGIPFTANVEDGKEFIRWPSEHDTAAEAINQKVRAGPFGNRDRNAHIPDRALQQQFVDWLTKKGIQHDVVKSHGKDYVVWDEGKGDLVREFMESRGSTECGKVAAGKSRAASC
jgi:hypothetical protein